MNTLFRSVTPSPGTKINNCKLINIINTELQNRHKWKWECQCLCGAFFQRGYSYIQRAIRENYVVSCGCQSPLLKNTGDKSKVYTGYKLISGSFYSNMKGRAKKWKLEWDVSIEYLWELFESQNGRCAISGLEIILVDRIKEIHRKEREQTASLDRINSDLGYIPGNVWWTHKDINKIKSDLPLDEFIKICKLVVDYNKSD